MMDYNLTAELQKHLDANEKLLWTGQPKKGIVFRKVDIFLIPFSLVWCGFSIFWLVSVINANAPLAFTVFGIPFVMVGLTLVFGRFFIDAKQRANTYYGLTNERMIIKKGIFSKSIKSLSIKTLFEIEYDEQNDGSGTISIGPRSAMWTNGMNWWPGIETTPSFDMIPDVRKVYNKIVELQKAS